MILRAMSPPPTSRAPAPSPNSEATLPLIPPVAGSRRGAAPPPADGPAEGGEGLGDGGVGCGAGGVAAAFFWVVWVHVPVTSGVTVISLPVKSISSVLSRY